MIVNNKGMTLLGALISIAILSIIITAIFNVVDSASSSQKNLEQKVASMYLTNDIVVALSNKIACINSIPTNQPMVYSPGTSPTVISGINNIKNDVNSIVYSIYTDVANLNKSYQGGLLKINELSVYNYTPAATPSSATDPKFYSGTAKMKIVYEKMIKTPGSQIFVKEIPLGITLTNGGVDDKKIATCVALGLGGSLSGMSQWINTPSNDGIYYDKKVGIGSLNNPTVLLDIAVPDGTYAKTWFGKAGDDVYMRLKSTTTGAATEIRSQGSYQPHYLAFKDHNGQDTLNIYPGAAGTGTTSFVGIAPQVDFAVDALNFGQWRTDAANPGESQSYSFEGSPKGLIASTSNQAFMRINSKVNQSGSAGYSTLQINSIETSTGSGVKNILDLQRSGVTKFAFTSSGNLGVGVATPNYAIDSVGDINSSSCFRSGATVVGGVCTSDIRLKKNISEFNLGLDVLLKLIPKNYEFNGLGENINDGQKTVGLIAQEVEVASKELVSTKKVYLHKMDQNKTEIKTVNYSKIIYIVINSIKELSVQFKNYFDTTHSEINDLKITLDKLQKENELMQNKLILLQKMICKNQTDSEICKE